MGWRSGKKGDGWTDGRMDGWVIQLHQDGSARSGLDLCLNDGARVMLVELVYLPSLERYDVLLL